MSDLTIRYCMQCGLPAQRQKINKFVCDNHHENWLDPAPGATAFIFNQTGDAVLYGVRSIGQNAGRLLIVGGFIELGETAEDGIRREAREEMGINIELVELLGTYVAGYGDRWVLNMTYIARHNGDPLMPADDLSGGAPQWRSLQQLPGADEIAWPWYLTAQRDLQRWHEHHSERLRSA